MLKKVVYGRSSSTWISFILAERISAIPVHTCSCLCKNMCLIWYSFHFCSLFCVCVCHVCMCVSWNYVFIFYCGHKLQKFGPPRVRLWKLSKAKKKKKCQRLWKNSDLSFSCHLQNVFLLKNLNESSDKFLIWAHRCCLCMLFSFCPQKSSNAKTICMQTYSYVPV